MKYKIDFSDKVINVDKKIELLTISEILNDIANYERTQEQRFEWKIETKELSTDTVK